MSAQTEWGVRRLQGDTGSVAGPMPECEARYLADQLVGEVVKRIVVVYGWHQE